jgi:hypothetical protein
VSATIETDLRTMTRIWRGELTWAQSQRSGALWIQGPSHVGRNLPRWLPKQSITVLPQPV